MVQVSTSKLKVKKMSDQERIKKHEEETKRIAETVSKIKHRIAVFSGKGGEGKTNVHVNLDFALHLEGFENGKLDA